MTRAVRYALAAVLASVGFATGAEALGKRIQFRKADNTGWNVLGDKDSIATITVTQFNGGGRCRAWIVAGGTKKDLNGPGVTVDAVTGSRISIETCDECKPGTNDCKQGSPVGSWPITAGDSNPVAEATWYIGAGIRGAGQASAKANYAE